MLVHYLGAAQYCPEVAIFIMKRERRKKEGGKEQTERNEGSRKERERKGRKEVKKEE